MREILFRGKRIDNGEWVEGNLFIPDSDSRPIQIECGTDIMQIAYEIAPETIGQYTGLTDKNGVKIFEHDICKDSLGTLFVVEWDSANARFIGRMVGGEHRIVYVSKEPRVEVIGNIYDNPELLKENENA